jgi:hypothetical protein
VTAPQDPFSTPPQGPPATPPGGYGAPDAQPPGYGAPSGPPPEYGQPQYGQQPVGQPQYGQPQYGQPQFGQPGFGHQGSPRNGFGIAALVLGILALITCWTVLGGIVFGLIAAILGFLGRGRAKKGEANNGGMALTGAILGLLGLAASIVFAVVVGSLLSRGDFGSLTECLESAGNDQAAIDECSADFEDSVTG